MKMIDEKTKRYLKSLLKGGKYIEFDNLVDKLNIKKIGYSKSPISKYSRLLTLHWGVINSKKSKKNENTL